MKEYDLIVIGAGPGGYEAAFEAADFGMKTALVEKEALGGTCLNHGCIPTKSLLHAADLYRSMKEASLFGLNAEGLSYDPLRMQERKNEVVLTLRKGIEATAKKKKVDLYFGFGSVPGPGQVHISGAQEETLHAKNILIAAGSRPVLPKIPGIDLPGVLTSDGLLELDTKIDHLVIIGGGVIGVEFASVFNALGTAVTVIEAMPQLLPSLDREIAQSLKMLMKKRGIEVLCSTRVKEIRKEGEVLVSSLDTADGQKGLSSDLILAAVGRKPCSDGLFPADYAPQTDRGRIIVNENGETSLSGVYAIGDITGGIMLAHAASAAGKNAVHHMANDPSRMDTRFIPSCIYTEPEIACVGLSLDEAKAAGFNADSHKIVMSSNGKTVLSGAERGFIRVVYEKESRKLLGAQMMCERATDIISEFTEALTLGLTLEDLRKAVRPHPTFSEAVGDALNV